MVQRQIVVRRPQRLPVPLHQIVPLLLLPPALIGAASLLLGMSIVPFLCACAISCLGFALVAGVAGKRQRAMVAVAHYLQGAIAACALVRRLPVRITNQGAPLAD